MLMIAALLASDSHDKVTVIVRNIGGHVEQFAADANANYGEVKKSYSEKLGIDILRIRFIRGADILTDDIVIDPFAEVTVVLQEIKYVSNRDGTAHVEYVERGGARCWGDSVTYHQIVIYI